MSGSAGGGRKSARKSNSLAAYPTPLNGGLSANVITGIPARVPSKWPGCHPEK